MFQLESIKEDFRKFRNPSILFLFISSFAVGMFHEPAAIICGIVLSLFLFLKQRKKKWRVHVSAMMIFMFIFSLSFLFVSLWSVDTYYSILGFLKFFPLFLFYLHISTQEDFNAHDTLIFVPYSAVIMSVISFVFSRFAFSSYLFSADGRISGFFQYPNTFALFLIIGILVLANRKDLSFIHLLMMAVMIFGIFMSGSRTGFVVFILTLISLFFTSKNKTVKIAAIVITAILLLAAGIYVIVTGKHGALARFLTISDSSSTFKGRLLYIKDAFHYVLKHPFGNGYMGYYFAQGSFQTGRYATAFVHNELLQIALDVGWLPALACVFFFIKSLIKREKPLLLKIIAGAIFLHSMLDFNLQFLTIDFILLICLYDAGVEKAIQPSKAKKVLGCGILGIIICMGLYFGASSLCFLFSKYDVAATICPHNTMAQIQRLKEGQDVVKNNETADIILENNQTISNAYYAKAAFAYRFGDLDKFMENSEQAIRCNRYNANYYESYCTSLIQAYHNFEKQGDEKNRLHCLSALTMLHKKMQLLKSQTDKLAYAFPEKPDIELSQKTQQQLQSILTHSGELTSSQGLPKP